MHIKQAHQLSWCAWVFWYYFIWFHVSTRHGAYSMLFNLHLLFFPGFHLMPVSSSCTHTGEENHSCRRHHNNSWISAVKYPGYTILLLPPVWSGAGESCIGCIYRSSGYFAGLLSPCTPLLYRYDQCTSSGLILHPWWPAPDNSGADRKSVV